MKLFHQVLGALLATLALVVLLVVALVYASIARGFEGYVRGIEESRLSEPVRRLERVYRDEGGWDALARDPERFRRMLRRERDDSAPERPAPREPRDRPPPRDARSRDPLEIPARVSLYDRDQRRIHGTGTFSSDTSHLPIRVDGSTVGWLGLRPIDRLDAELDLQYLRQVRAHLAAIVAFSLALGLVASVLLARRMARPIEALRGATHKLASGDYSANLPVDRADEFGDLARDVRSLSLSLADAERSRRQWIADTSHELRTPVTVLKAEIEAMLDGVRPIDASAISSLATELERLSKLIEDLAELSRADQATLIRERRAVAPVSVLEAELAQFAPRFERAALTIEREFAEDAAQATVLGDRGRLAQLFANLLENSLRYTDRGGRVRVSATRDGGSLRITVDDSAPSVDPAMIPKLFDRFFRADSSRSRASGGAGLGLSICKNIAIAHGATIVAHASPLGGLRIELTLPIAP
ncbi:MAG: ATP-binding protein [Polyangiales bacterium]